MTDWNRRAVFFLALALVGLLGTWTSNFVSIVLIPVVAPAFALPLFLAIRERTPAGRGAVAVDG